jgi:hypothetical protein
MSKTGRNAPCPCESGKKYKACCLKADRADKRRPVRGTFDPDLPVEPESGREGNWQASDGSWYVIRSGHGLPDTPELKGERLDRAWELIRERNARKAKKTGKASSMLAAGMAALAWGAMYR